MARSLWVTNDFPPRPGGIEAFVASLVGRLDPTQTRVLAAGWPGDAAHDAALPYPVQRVGRRPLLPGPRLASRVRAAARAHRADVVVFGAAWPLGDLAGRLGLPTFALTHGHEAGMVRVGLGRLVRRAVRGLDGVGVISDFTGAVLAPWLAGVAVHRLAPGVDTATFHPDVDGAVVRARHGVPPGQPLTVCVSRLVRRKGQDVLVEAWPAVRARVPGAVLLLGGSGPLEQHLRQRVRALRLDGAVVFAGALAWADLPAYHAAGDLFAMPCRTRWRGLDVEGLGIVYLEAQACGTPVVAGRSGGAPEALVDGRTGVTVDGASPAAVADAVADLLADPDRLRRMGAAARALVERRHAWDMTAARLERILADPATPAVG